MALTLRKFADEAIREDIEKFFEKRDNSGYDRTLRIVNDTVSSCSWLFFLEARLTHLRLLVIAATSRGRLLVCRNG